MHLHRNEQNTMNTREIIENRMLLDRKKQNQMNTREIIEHLMHPSNSQLQSFMIRLVRVLCMYVTVVTSCGINIVCFMLINFEIPILRLTNIFETRKTLITIFFFNSFNITILVLQLRHMQSQTAYFCTVLFPAQQRHQFHLPPVVLLLTQPEPCKYRP